MENNIQKDATLPFLNIDMQHWGPTHQGSHLNLEGVCNYLKVLFYLGPSAA